VGLNASGLKELLKLALQAARLSRQLGTDAAALEKTWKPSELEVLLEEVRASDKFKASAGVHPLGRQLVSVVRSQGKTGEKRKPEGLVDGDKGAGKPKKKKRSA
jgi:hypothetical protein